MARSVHLRPWQRAALDAFRAADAPDFLAVATPGAGKTTFALTAAAHHLAAHPSHHLVVVAPTQHLEVQWARAAARLGLHLQAPWSPREGRLPADMHGVVVSYQKVAMNPVPWRAMSPTTFVVFDELHHAGDDQAWGEGIRRAFALAPRRLALSGTPFRSDTAAIPFVHYDGFGEARADFEYGYGDALRDGRIVRPVYFPRIDGHMEWVAPDGSEHSHTFADALDPVRASQRLRTALSLEGQWLPAVLDQAHHQLTALREHQPDAGGLIIATDRQHARGIVEVMVRRHRVHPTLVLSDDPQASARIERFADGTMPWMVAVRMVSEGVDIPRLRVGVYATTTATELFFRQATGRLVRWTRGLGRGQKAFLFVPDDPRLRRYAAGIAEQRRHQLRPSTADDDGSRDGDLDELPPEGPQEEQLSLFAVISAVALDGDRPEWELDDEAAVDADDPDEDDDGLDAGLVVALAVPARGTTPMPGSTGAGTTRAEQKAALRAQNTDAAREIARRTGMTHGQVNGELNRLTGIATVAGATADQLHTRLQHADRWQRRL